MTHLSSPISHLRVVFYPFYFFMIYILSSSSHLTPNFTPLSNENVFPVLILQPYHSSSSLHDLSLSKPIKYFFHFFIITSSLTLALLISVFTICYIHPAFFVPYLFPIQIHYSYPLFFPLIKVLMFLLLYSSLLLLQFLLFHSSLLI